MEQNTICSGGVVEYAFVEGKIPLKTEDIIYIETSKHKNTFIQRKKTIAFTKS